MVIHLQHNKCKPYSKGKSASSCMHLFRENQSLFKKKTNIFVNHHSKALLNLLHPYKVREPKLDYSFNILCQPPLVPLSSQLTRICWDVFVMINACLGIISRHRHQA